MIAIQSNKKLQFPPANVGYVKMEIDLIQNKPSEEVYELRIIDTCFDKVIEKQLKKDYILQITPEKPINLIEPKEEDYEDVEVIKILGTNTRLKKYTYAQLKELSIQLNVDFSDNSLTLQNINELFQKGLLIIIQLECQQGISGKDKGMYFSKIEDWQILK
jgi:hypothetical protein